MLTYVSRLSTLKESLSYSSTKGTLPSSAVSSTQVRYYREKEAENRLVYDADRIDQLGINLKDLRDEYMNQSGTCSRIETTALYDLSGVRNLTEILRRSSGIRFTLSLRAKDADLEYQAAHLKDGNQYIQLSPDDSTYRFREDGCWSWVIPRESYMDGDSIKADSGFESAVFAEKFPVWVRVDNVETLSHFYANYKLELSAEVIDAQGRALVGPDSDYLVYTITKILPEFVE